MTRKIVAQVLASYGYIGKFTLRTVDFVDLARDSATFCDLKERGPWTPETFAQCKGELKQGGIILMS